MSEQITPCDPNVQPSDTRRLAGQNAAILAALQDGPKTNTELAAMSLKYTSRISDVRAAGYKIIATRRGGGLTIYTLDGAA